MYLDEILAILMSIDADTCPCEEGIPCPLYQPCGDCYCLDGNCLEGMSQLIKKVIKENYR